MLRFVLSHAALGERIINAPSGWENATFNLERHPDYHSLFETFNGEFIFYGSNGFVDGGLDFILEVEDLEGPDATLEILVYVYDNGTTPDLAFRGQLAIDGIKHNDRNQAMVPIIRTDFTTIFKNRVDTPVDIMKSTSIDGGSVDVFGNIAIDTVSQIIDKTTTYLGSIIEDGFIAPEFEMPGGGVPIDDGGLPDDLWVDAYLTHTQAQTLIEQDEITQSFEPLFEFITDPIDIAPPIEMLDESGEMTVTIENSSAFVAMFGSIFISSSETDPSVITSIEVEGVRWYQINEDTPVLLGSSFDDTQAGLPTPVFVGIGEPFSRFFSIPIPDTSFTITLNAADTLRVYIEWRVRFNVSTGDASGFGTVKWASRKIEMQNYASDTTIKFKSTFPDTLTSGFFIHDTAGQILDRITNRSDTFYSNRLGSDKTIYRQYEDDGCDWKYALAKGLQIRQYTLTEKPFFISFKNWWECVSPILNLGLGYEVIDGLEMMRCEERSYFYDPVPEVFLSNVKMERQYDDKVIYKKIKVGYKTWQSSNISGIDDPQTKRTYASTHKKMGTELVIESDAIAASLAWEETRRQTRKKSVDYKYDDNNFIVSVNPEETAPYTYIPELDENFTFITGLLNAETRYNSRLTPARNLIRHLSALAGGQYPYNSSSFKFSGGEGNYDMDSDLDNADCDDFSEAVSEKQDIPIGNDYTHIGQAYLMEDTPLTWEEYKGIRDNRKKAIGISQTDTDHKPFFIKTLDYDINKNLATILAWPAEFFRVISRDRDPVMMSCSPQEVDECLNAYLTQSGEEFITEDDECLILN